MTDAVGQELVSQVMDVVMKFPHVSGPTQKLGLTKEDLSQAYTEMIKFLMPEPLVWWHTSFQVLAPTSLFFLPATLEAFVAELGKHTGEKAGEERRMAIKQASVACTERIYANKGWVEPKHLKRKKGHGLTMKQAEAAAQATGSGCLTGVIVVLVCVI